MDRSEILIVGAGIAGFSAAKSASGRGAAVTLVGDEKYPPYWRPLLPKVVSQGWDIGRLLIERPEWYERAAVKLLLGRRLIRLDTAGKVAFFEDGSALAWDRLILAMGSSAFIPSLSLKEQPLALRSYDDALLIRHKALKSERVALVGGGLLSLELAYELSRMGLRITVAERNPYLLPRQLDREGGQFLSGLLGRMGIATATGFDAQKHEQILEGACVIAAAGVRANIAVLDGTGIATPGGVAVDSRMRTAADGIYACGDIALFGGRSWGLVEQARLQGAVAGLCAAGAEASYRDIVPSPTLAIGPVRLASCGDLSDDGEKRFYRKITEESYAVYALKDGIVCGAAFIGDVLPAAAARAAVEQGLFVAGATSAEEISALISELLPSHTAPERKNNGGV